MTGSPFLSKVDFQSSLASLEARFSKSVPELAVTITDPDLGVEGYLVVWNSEIARNGPLGACGKGGTRIHPNVTLDEIALLAKIMALKNAAAGLPLGGAKSGLRADPDAEHFEKQYRRFIDLSRPYVREHGGIFGGFGFDIGARPIHARWACETLGSLNSFTGKPLDLGGTDYDREGIAGFGVIVAARETLEANDESLQDSKIAIQGIGAMGAAVLRYALEHGANVRAIADPRIGGCVQCDAGIPSELADFLMSGKFEEAKAFLSAHEIPLLPLDSIFETACDVFFPCAMQNVITEKNWSTLRCRYLVEGANSPCSREAQRKLFESGVCVIPDFLANPGGVIAAFVELSSTVSVEENVKNKTKVKEAKSLTERKISENIREVMRISKALAVEPRDVGMFLALSRIYPPDR